MDKARLLSALSAAMMRQFSARTADRLKQDALFGVLLPVFQEFLDINVSKEIEKDRRVIDCAVAALRAGSAPQEADLQRLLRQAREIDQTFLRQAAVFSVNIHIEYRDIEPIRRRRIERLLEAAQRLLAQWQLTPRFRATVASLYTPDQFRSLLREILQLYASETKILSHSVHIPQIFIFARDSLADTVYSAMSGVAEELAGELSRKVYRRAR